MTKKKAAAVIFLIGVMSGTSLDALDAVLIGYRPRTQTVRVVQSHSLPYSDSFRTKVRTACDPAQGYVDLICDLNIGHARLTTRLVQELLQKARLSKNKIHSIGYHGQTLWHRTQKVNFSGDEFLSTLQVGDGPTLAVLTGIPVINNFRTKDQALGGQGAPLVPFGHKLLFGKKTGTVVVNLGGIVNLTSLIAGNLAGFDLGPCNLLLDALSEMLTGQRFDVDGALAARGQADDEVLNAFLADDFFSRTPPKSTGRERYGHDYASQFAKFAMERHLGVPDILATATSFIAKNLAWQVHYFLPENKTRTIVLCGGGAKHRELCRQIGLEFAKIRASIQVKTSEEFGYAGQDIECICFALLGYYACNQLPNSLGKLTGSGKNLSLGQISWP